jgi:hypothetical protein
LVELASVRTPLALAPLDVEIANIRLMSKANKTITETIFAFTLLLESLKGPNSSKILRAHWRIKTFKIAFFVTTNIGRAEPRLRGTR